LNEIHLRTELLLQNERMKPADRDPLLAALAREHGFGRLSLDLMFAYPGHDAERWGRTLNRALALEPEHLSAYCFIPEAETPMGRAVLRGEQALPPHDAQADLYAQLEERVARAGYGCYETSNFARPAAEARHNLVYWLRRDYLGLGPSAHALWRGVREGNAYALDTWASRLERDEPCGEIEPETEVSRADEIVMLGLRLATGLVRADYADAVWRSVARRYAAAFRAGAATGRIEATADGCRIAARHRFVADDVIAWLMAAAERHDPAAVVDSSESVSVPSAPCLIHHSPAA
jgi:oxygen-independent coproporphyrinogen-3 oxidase